MVLVREETGDLVALDPSATLAWQCFDGVATLNEIAADVADVFGISPEQAAADLVELAASLRAQGFASPAGGDLAQSSGSDGPVLAERHLANPPNP